MSKHTAPSAPPVPSSGPAHTVHQPAAAARTHHRSILITPQQVAFSTAAAVPLPRRRLRTLPYTLSHFVPSVLVSARTRWRTRAERRPVRRDYPSRLSYLEYAAMSREMDRL